MHIGEVYTASVIIRNSGDAFWNNGAGFSFGQIVSIETDRFLNLNKPINDMHDEISTFGGIFRGRPKTFVIELKAPEIPGTYYTKWSMWKDGIGWFGEEIIIPIEVDQTTSIYDENEINSFSKVFALLQNFPNPFNPTTIIEFEIPKLSHVKLLIFDILGRRIKTLVDDEKTPGLYKVEFDASNLTSGVYFYRLQTSSFYETKKFMLLH